MCTQKMTYLLLPFIDLFLVLLARRCTQMLGYFNINNVVEPLCDTHADCVYIYDEASQYIMVFWNYEFFVTVFCRSRFMHKKNHHRHTNRSIYYYAVPLSIRFTGSKHKVHAVIPLVRSAGFNKFVIP